MRGGRAFKESDSELGACGILLPSEEMEISVGTEPSGMPSWGWLDMIGALESGRL